MTNEIEKLEDIIDKIQELSLIYNIHFCRAGVGFVLYNGDGTEDNFKDALSVETYYPDIRTAAEKTLESLTTKGE